MNCSSLCAQAQCATIVPAMDAAGKITQGSVCDRGLVGPFAVATWARESLEPGIPSAALRTGSSTPPAAGCAQDDKVGTIGPVAREIGDSRPEKNCSEPSRSARKFEHRRGASPPLLRRGGLRRSHRRGASGSRYPSCILPRVKERGRIRKGEAAPLMMAARQTGRAGQRPPRCIAASASAISPSAFFTEGRVWT
jgi:hypothetical protein